MAKRRASLRGARHLARRATSVPALGRILSVVGLSHRYDYDRWFRAQRPGRAELAAQRQRTFAYAPVVSFVVPVYNPPPGVLRAMLDSVLAQTYARWELCLANGDASNERVRRVLDGYARADDRIHVTHLAANQGISGNSNAALDLARGDYVALLDHDDLIEPNYAYEVVAALNAHETPHAADIVYFDQDKVSADGALFTEPEFKPAWSPELLLTSPLPIHPVLKRSSVVAVGGFDPATDGTQDWDLFLRLSERTAAALHIPRVLYHWRTVAASAASSLEAKPYVYERQLGAITRHLERRGRAGAAARFERPGIMRVSWQPRGLAASVIIPVRDDVARLRPCLGFLRARAGYDAYEVVLVDMGSTLPETRRFFEEVAQDARVSVVRGEGALTRWQARNLGVRAATGEVLVFLDGDVRALDDGWLAELVRWAEVPEVGVVGARVLNARGQIEHAGLVFGLGDGPVGSLFAGCDPAAWSEFGNAAWYRNPAAVGGACHVLRRDLFALLGGYDEGFHADYADADLCLRAAARGLRTVYTPFARFQREASRAVTPGSDGEAAADYSRALAQFAAILERGDPAYNPHLALTSPLPRLARRTQAPAMLGPRVPIWAEPERVASPTV